MGAFSDMDIELQSCETSAEAHTLIQSWGIERRSDFYSKCFQHWYKSKYDFEDLSSEPKDRHFESLRGNI